MSEADEKGKPQPARGSLIPSLGLFSTIMLVAGGVIGSGIFRKPGVMAAQLGSPEALLAVWLLAGVITLFGALANAEIAAAIPETGGQFVFFDRLYGPFVAFLYGWAAFTVFQTGSITAVCYVFAEYGMQLVPLPSLPEASTAFSFHLPFIGDITPWKDFTTKCVAAAVIVILTAVNYVGVRFGGLVQNVVTLAKFAAMLTLVILVFIPPLEGSVSNLSANSLSISPSGLGWWSAMAAAMAGAFWAYDGWNKITYVAGEVKEPQRNLPRGLIIGMVLVTALYLLMNAAYSYAMPIDDMAKSKLVAANVAELCVPGGGRWIALAVMLSTFGAANAIILASARVYFSMARHGMAPRFLGRVHPRFHTPAAALVVQGLWAVILLFSGTFDQITDMLIFVIWIFYAAGAWGVVTLRRREPNLPRPYRVPGYPVVPIVFVLFAIAYLALTIHNDIAGYRAAVAAGKPALINSALGLALVLVGTPIYLIYRRR
ncbi:MAG TPA: amino acid permease [Candidatus Acidoferrales bacterium]|nr:amino acid permease [Candidatus Acidoferrales bacterium]